MYTSSRGYEFKNSEELNLSPEKPRQPNRTGRHPGGRPLGSKNKNTADHQRWYKDMCQRILRQPEVEEFLHNIAVGKPIGKETYEIADPKTKTLLKRTRYIYADVKLRVDVLRDLRDGSGCKPIFLLDGNAKDGSKNGAKPSFNIAIGVVD